MRETTSVRKADMWRAGMRAKSERAEKASGHAGIRRAHAGEERGERTRNSKQAERASGHGKQRAAQRKCGEWARRRTF
jgi:hypothetical protein